MSAEPQQPEPVNPWPGLASYTEEDWQRFFGREVETTNLLRLLERDRLTVLFGRSGFGKTSLLQAGLAPTLRESGSLPIFVRIDYAHGTPHPLEQVKVVSCETAAKAGIESVFANASPQPDATLWEFFCALDLWGPRNDIVTPVLIFDQFEEVFTLGRSNPYTQGFLDELADLAENRVPNVVRERAMRTGARITLEGQKALYKIVLSLREDYVSQLDSLSPIMPAIMRNRLALGALDRQTAESVIVRAGGEWVSKEVARLIVRAVAGATPQTSGEQQGQAVQSEIEPAYLSVMCHELFSAMVASHRPVIDGDMVMREQASIIEALYQRSFSGLDVRVREFVEDDLLTAAGFRSSLPVADAVRDGVTAKDLERLVNCRLLRFEDRLGTRQVEISHDLLTPVARASRERRRGEQQLRSERARTEHLLAEQRLAQRKQRIATSVALALAVCLLGSIFVSYYCFFAEHTSIYRSYGKRRGFYVGLDPLTVKQARQNACSYELKWKGVRWTGWRPHWNPPRKLIAVNGYLEPTEDCPIGSYLWRGQYEASADNDSRDQSASDLPLNKLSQAELVTDANGDVAYERGFDKNGRVLWAFVYSPTKKDVEVSSPTKKDVEVSRMARFVGRDGFPQLQRADSAAEYVVISDDEQGWEAKIRYRDRLNRPALGPDGAFGVDRHYDPAGRLLSEISVDTRGQPMVDRAGHSGMHFFYDSVGLLVEERSVGPDQKPMPVKDGYAAVRFVFDARGRLIKQTYWDAAGHPVLHREGYHGFSLSYDERGNVTASTWFGPDGRPCLGSQGFATRKHSYDSKGRLLRETYHGVLGEPVIALSGRHGREFAYDPRGLISEETSVGTDGKPHPQNGIATTRYAYDERGNQTRYSVHGIHGEAVLDSDGYHGWIAEYDQRDHPVTQTWLGLDGQPVALEGGVATVRSVYDDRGNEIRRTYYGPHGECVVDEEDGKYGWAAEYDDLANCTAQTFLDCNDRPFVVLAEGYAKVLRAFDRGKKRIEERYFGANGETPALYRGIFHRATARYNEFGKQTEARAWGIRGERVVGDEGYHRWTERYDARGYEIESAYFGTDDMPVLSAAAGAHLVVTSPNLRGQPERTAFFGIRREPVRCTDGYHAERREYDEMGRIVSQTWEDVDGKPMLLREGYASSRSEYGPWGQIRERFFGADGRPTLHRDGYHGWEKTYDEQGQLASQTWIGLDGKPVLHKEGYATIRWGYTLGRETEKSFFGAQGEPVLNKDGYHRWVKRYDEGGQALGTSYFDSKGRPVRCGSAIVVGQVSAGEGMLAGIRSGDIIWAYDGWRYFDGKDFPDVEKAGRDLISHMKAPGKEKRRLVLVRDGRLMTLYVRPGLLGVEMLEKEVGEDILRALASP